MFQKGMIQIVNEDSEVIEDPNVVATVDGEEGPLNGKPLALDHQSKDMTCFVFFS